MNRREGDRGNVPTNEEFMERVLAVFGMDDGSGQSRERGRKGKEREEKGKEKNEEMNMGMGT